MVFRIYGAVCAVFFILFIAVNFFNREEGKFMADLPDDMDPKNVSVSFPVLKYQFAIGEWKKFAKSCDAVYLRNEIRK